MRLFGHFALFWILFQISIRGLFLVYNYEFTRALTWTEIVTVFIHGLRMDISLCGYFLLVVGLILTVSVFVNRRWVFNTLNAVTIILVIVSMIIVTIDIELYRHWGFRLNTTPLFYIESVGSEAIGSVSSMVVINLLAILLLFSGAVLYLYFKILAPKIAHLHPTAKKSWLPLLALSALMFLPIRGSFSVAPMNTGFVYFHKTKAYANHAAINAIWNFMYSLRSSSQIRYPENFFDKNSAQDYFSSLYPTSDSTFHLFNKAKPNVILLIVESFTADIIEPLGGMPGIAPAVSKMCKEGILFDNFFSSGDRTDKGIVSILS